MKLIFAEDFNTRDEAQAAELRIKHWVRRKKLALVRRDWAEIRRLARGPDRPNRGAMARSSFD